LNLDAIPWQVHEADAIQCDRLLRMGSRHHQKQEQRSRQPSDSALYPLQAIFKIHNPIHTGNLDLRS
jgi:hypothetical protein